MRNYNDEGILEENFQIKEFIHKKRIVSMINNDSATKAEFEYLTVNQARMIIARKIKNEKKLDELMESVEDKMMTGF